MENTIILIGPICCGKSTIAQLLAEALAVPRHELDELRWAYYREIGYDEQAAVLAASEQGMMGIINYWKPFEAHAVERALADHSNCVIDCGAGHSVYEDEALFSRVAQALAPFPQVILLLPSPDLAESVRILNGRFADLLSKEMGEADPELLRLNEDFVRRDCNRRLAKMTIYTQGETPEQTAQRILHGMAGRARDNAKTG